MRPNSVFAWCLCTILMATLLTGSPAPGETRDDSKMLTVEAFLSNASVRPGGTFQVAVVATIKPGYHINSHEPEDEFLVPTVVEFNETRGIAFGPAGYPVPKLISLSFSPKKMSVYDEKISIIAAGRISDDVSPGDVKVSGVFSYQGCDDKSCYMPQSEAFELPVKIVGKEDPVSLINKAVFEQKPSLTPDELRAKEVIEKGLIYAVVAFFFFGLALNLTPCVYPVIPMTVSYFGSQGAQKRGKTFVLALYYVVGIASVFSLLGLISGVAGKQWGFLFQSPWFVIFISMIILAMAASMFGAFEITVPASLMTFGSKSRQGVIGSFIMGLTAGVIIAPCAAGIILGLVGIVAKLGLVAKGALLFFVMGLGLGIPYLFLATFSGLMNRLPKSGMWMVWIRKFFGVFLIGVALYFLIPQGKQLHDQQSFYLGILGIFGGLLLGFLEHAEGYNRVFKIVRAIAGCLLIAAGVFLVQRALHFEAPTIDWVRYENQTVEQLGRDGKPILMDFYADWCAACKELDTKTFSDATVADRSGQFVMVRVDCTSVTAGRTALMKRFKISGLPTVVFLTPAGRELPDLRQSGFLGPSEMAERMDKALAH